MYKVAREASKPRRHEGCQEAHELAVSNIGYWAYSEVVNALCHLDNVAMRVAMKMCLRGRPLFEQILEAWKAAMTAEEKVKQGPSLDGLAISSTGHLQEIMWRWYCSGSSGAAIGDAIWNPACHRSRTRRICPVPAQGEALDFYGFEFLGLSHDQLRVGTWNVLKRKVRVLQAAGVDPSVLDFAAKTHEEVRSQIRATGTPGMGTEQDDAGVTSAFTKGTRAPRRSYRRAAGSTEVTASEVDHRNPRAIDRAAALSAMGEVELAGGRQIFRVRQRLRFTAGIVLRSRWRIGSWSGSTAGTVGPRPS